jgi:Flp pilus assembly protein TadG
VKHLGLIGAVLPLVLLAIGLIGWVLTVRNDVTAAVKQITAVQEEITAINERMENERTIRTDLHTDQAGDLVTITNGSVTGSPVWRPTSFWLTTRWRPSWGTMMASRTYSGNWERSAPCRPGSGESMAGTASDAIDGVDSSCWHGHNHRRCLDCGLVL